MSRKPTIPDNDCEEHRSCMERRQYLDRRCNIERRFDFRDGSAEKGKNKRIRVWFKQLTKARLGVDRRKGERRGNQTERREEEISLLTAEELHDLLSL